MQRSVLNQRVTGRATSLFAADRAAHQHALHEVLDGARVVVVGAAGSIGSATVRVLSQFPLRRLVLCDSNENGLVEVLRDLRSGRHPLRAASVRVAPLNAGAPAMALLAQEEAEPDLLLNFAASKHVRAERDVPSLLHMLETNVLVQQRLQAWFCGPRTRRFAVSTDKAANPVSLMGASKRLMEQVVLHGQPDGPAVTTRFANVAFSAGSLLESWLFRFEKQQAMAVPEGVRRFFVSEEEAGDLCTLAAVLGTPGHVLIPTLDPSRDSRPLRDVLTDVLDVLGRVPRIVPDEDTARRTAPTDREWPVLITPADTAGEKPYEEFVGAGEHATPSAFTTLALVRPAPVSPDLLATVLAQIAAWCAAPPAALSKRDIVRCLATAVPELRHLESDRSLDDRM